MPREDLSKKLVASLLDALDGVMDNFFREARRVWGYLESGHVKYEIVPKEGITPYSDYLYREFANFYEMELGCDTTFDEFSGDPVKNIPAAIEGIFIVCNNNTILLHIELRDDQLELSAWLRG